MKNFLKLFVVFVLSAAIAFAACYYIRPYISHNSSPKTSTAATSSKGKTSTSSGTSVGVSNVTNESPIVLIEEVTTQEPEPVETVSYADPVVNTSNVRVKVVIKQTEYHYTVTRLSATSAGTTSFVIEDNEGHKYTSPNGVFNNVAANNTGEYTVIVRDTDHNLVSTPKTIRGFVKHTPITNKLTANELSNLFATGDYEGCRDSLKERMADDVKIVIASGDLKCPTFQEIFTAVYLEGWMVSVSSVEYDCLNRVSKIVVNASK